MSKIKALKSLVRPRPLPRGAILSGASARPTVCASRAPSPPRGDGSSAAPSSCSFSTTRAVSSSSSKALPAIPSPTPFCPDVATFLKLIGRGLSSHATKFPTWDALFSLTSEQLKELGIEPPRTRRYLIRWRQRFRLGRYGVGGDIRHVDHDKEGGSVARLAIITHDKDPVRPVRYVVNVPPGKSVKETPVQELTRVRGYKVKGARTIVGPYALPVRKTKGEGVRIPIVEGMWEDKRGHKVDGGERRRVMVRFKKRIQEGKEARERAESR